jgi:gluconate 5-dehydrogenase
MSLKLFDLSGKTALITGSSRGLGFAFAEGLGGCGATIVLNGTNPERLEQSAAKLSDKGITVHCAAFDVTDTAAIARAIPEIEATTGGIDILINNAGVQHRVPLEDFPEADWRRVMETNLMAPFLLTQAVVPAMIQRRAGKIINICSLTSEVGRQSIGPYVTSKGGLKMLTKQMAVEWAKHNIQANAIGPGYTTTEMNTALMENPEFNAWVCSRTPAGRWADPDELAGAAIFLSSKASDFVNGQIIYVDGGFLSTM